MEMIAIDPGPTSCGVVGCEQGASMPRVVYAHASMTPADVVALVRAEQPEEVVCEWLTTYGATIGASVLDTARVVGRIEQVAHDVGARVTLITRPDVCWRLCQRRGAKKSATRAALLAMYPATGGGATPQVGTLRAPGPLHGVTSHAWDALAVAVAHATWCA